MTAVLVDDLLIDVEPGDTSGSRHAIAFDLGTTTVVATLLDLETGQPKAVQSILNTQQPFGADVISRISRDDDGRRRARRCCSAHAHETLQQLTDEVCEEGGVDPAEVYEIVVAGNVTMIQLALGIDPGAALDGAVHDRRAPAARGDARPTSASRVHERAPAVMFPALGAYVGPGHRRRHPRDRPHARPAHPALHRRRHELGDRARLVGEGARDGRARRARRSRRRRSAAACARPTARSRA